MKSKCKLHKTVRSDCAYCISEVLFSDSQKTITIQDLIDFEKYREQENKKRYKNKLKYEHQWYHKNHMSELETREIPDTISELLRFIKK